MRVRERPNQAVSDIPFLIPASYPIELFSLFGLQVMDA